MKQPEIIVDLQFGPPTITGKLYITVGPSGWPETFDRKKTDLEVKVFLQPLDPIEVVDLFLTGRELVEAERKPVDWYTITGYLGRTMNVSPRMVPHAVAIGFWGQVVIAALARIGN